MSAPVDLEEKRARLIDAADLERMRFGFALSDLRRAISPPADISRRARVRPIVVRAVGYALPVLGYHRMGRALRTAGAALAIWRAIKAWRDFHGR